MHSILTLVSFGSQVVDYVYCIFTLMHLADAFIQSDLQCIQAIHFYFISMCVPWESNPQPLRC